MSEQMPAFFVVCDCYTAGPFKTAMHAERVKTTIEKAGHCKLVHKVEERSSRARVHGVDR